MQDGEEPVVVPTLESLHADRIAGQPTCSGGAAERPDLLELALSGRVGAKSASREDEYLAVPKLLQRAQSSYEAVRPVSRVPGLFPLSTDLTNEYLKQDDRRLPAEEEYLWMSCFGAHMAALFVALDELLPYVPAASSGSGCKARAWTRTWWWDAGVAAKVSTSDGVGRLLSELLELCETIFR
eukprot:jgi/Tetstr1/427883/TSEL_017959.t1